MSLQAGSARKSFTDFLWLFRGHLYALRTQWFWYVVMLTLTPVTFVFFLWLFGARSAEASAIVITGSLANSSVSGAMLSLGQQIGRLKDQNALEYYATLPISKQSFVLALATRGVVFSLPSAVIVWVVGSAILRIALPVSWIKLLGVYIAGAYSLAGLGAVVGFYAASGQMAGLVTQVVGPLLVFFAPVYIPYGQLPRWLQLTSHFLPTTYMADGLRGAVGITTLRPVWHNTIVLAVFTLMGLVITQLVVDWRAKSTLGAE